VLVRWEWRDENVEGDKTLVRKAGQKDDESEEDDEEEGEYDLWADVEFGGVNLSLFGEDVAEGVMALADEAAVGVSAAIKSHIIAETQQQQMAAQVHHILYFLPLTFLLLTSYFLLPTSYLSYRLLFTSLTAYLLHLAPLTSSTS